MVRARLDTNAWLELQEIKDRHGTSISGAIEWLLMQAGHRTHPRLELEDAHQVGPKTAQKLRDAGWNVGDPIVEFPEIDDIGMATKHNIEEVRVNFDEIRHRDNYTCQKCGLRQIRVGYTLPVVQTNRFAPINEANFETRCYSCY